MAHAILATATELIGWLRGTVNASTYVSLLPTEGTDYETVVAPDSILLRPLSAYIIEAIWGNEILTTSIILGLLIIAVNFARSPWRKLPLGPRRLPILGNALQLRDKSWLLSKDCKARFGEFTDNMQKWTLMCAYGHYRGYYVPRRGWTARGCV